MKAIKGMPMFSPVRGNAFGKAMADAGGDYDKAKAMLDNDVATMKSEYGTGAPTKMHHLEVPRERLTPQDRVKLEKKREIDLKNINKIISSETNKAGQTSSERMNERRLQDHQDQLTQQEQRLLKRIKQRAFNRQ
jgi:hypothetical protein